ncbi:MAG: arylsulfatase [Chitinophagia bacterium]|jgi:arylsulfatase
MKKYLQCISVFLFLQLLNLQETATIYAQFSPEKKYAQSYITSDTTRSKLLTAYQPQLTSGAPNIIIILLDDVGFGTSATFGGLAQTPTFDYLAKRGLRYTNFHTTALCAPSRAALLTGRNHHSVHMGHFTETAFDAPGYDGYMPFEKATMAEVLRENGYSCFAVGKWHLTPVAERTAAGPFNRWPTGRGFDEFYGFLESATDQYYPVLWEGHTPVKVDTAAGVHFNTLITNRAIEYISQVKKAKPEKPYFLLFAPGAVHSPLQVDKSWIDKYKGVFDEGYDVYREKTLARQQQMGLVPAGVTLPNRPAQIPAWNSLDPLQQKVFARAMEAHAGFLSETDYEIGRLIQYLESTQQMQNTLLFLIIGDNGATKYTAALPGLPAHLQHLEGEERFKAAYAHIDEIGVKNFKGDIPLGWTQAMNTPFRLFKCDANAEGGTRNPMIVVGERFVQEPGAIRTEFTHLIDIWPTILSVTTIKVPKKINGYLQQALEGYSFASTFHKEYEKFTHPPQYFETGAHRAIYADGWRATVYHTYGTPFSSDRWELFDTRTDFNEQKNLADEYPGKLKKMIKLFNNQAKKYHVFPLQESWFPADEFLQISDSRKIPK